MTYCTVHLKSDDKYKANGLISYASLIQLSHFLIMWNPLTNSSDDQSNPFFVKYYFGVWVGFLVSFAAIKIVFRKFFRLGNGWG